MGFMPRRHVPTDAEALVLLLYIRSHLMSTQPILCIGQALA